ncbi:hypothetical protein KL86PLE_110035 [uncultured Pleomorphomonas sp.]|uniref:Phage tail tape measure protein domain-containing protein n=2 Tax=uncultured Pleomorphomonas sp. TaxID=442121 RepID=A0A212L7A0_9HYPH|nr:hypothetical protein KL86PLE_110035 [uncultured Pleomorphomonas sp.]
MASREVEARLKMTAVDQASRVIERVGNKIDAIGKKMDAVNRAEKAVRQSQLAEEAAAAKAQKTKAMLIGATTIAAYAAARGAKDAFVNFAELERRMTRIGNTAGVSREETEKATSALFDMAQKTAMPFDQAIEGLDALVTSGKSLEEALSFLPSVLKVAQATGAETADLAQVATSFSNAMGIGAADLEKAFNAAAQAGNLGAFELKDMARYLPSILPLMRQAGYDGIEGVQRATAMLQTTRLGAGTAEEAATNLKNVLLKMESPQTTKYFKKTYGIDLPKYLDEAVRKGKDRVEAFIELSTKVAKGSTTAWQSIFPDAQFNQGATALRDYINKLHKYINELKTGADVISPQYEKVMADTQAKIDQLTNSWGMFTRSLGATVASIGVTGQLDALSQDLQDITKLVDAWKGGKDTNDAWNNVSVHGQERDYPGAKAYADEYRRLTGKEPPSEALAPYTGNLPERFGFISDERRKELEEAGRRGARAAALAPQYALRGDTGLLPVRFSNYHRGPDAAMGIPGGPSPLAADTFSGTPQYDPLTDPGAMLPGAFPKTELPFDEIQGRFGELTTDIVNSMADAHREVVNELDKMAKDMVQIINGIVLPPIKVSVQQTGQLARVNPGVSMPDQ